MSFSEHDKYLCTIRSQVRGRADLIITDISKGESRVIPLRWRQLLMISREAMQALDTWPLAESRPNGHANSEEPNDKQTSKDQFSAVVSG